MYFKTTAGKKAIKLMPRHKPLDRYLELVVNSHLKPNLGNFWILKQSMGDFLEIIHQALKR